MPAAFLYPPYPNPFNPSTKLSFELTEFATVSLAFFDLAGRRVATPLAGVPHAAGRQAVIWDGTDDSGHSLPSGVYLYEFTAGNYSATGKMTLLK